MYKKGKERRMNSKIKLIAIDMDGTLLNDEKELTPYTREALLKAIEQGVHVVACTGRPISAIPKELTKIEGVRYAISANGARIVDLMENKTVFEKVLPPDVVCQLLDIAQKYHTYYEVFFDGIGYTQEDLIEKLPQFLNDEMIHYIMTTRVRVDNIREELHRRNQGSDKLHIVVETTEEKEELVGALKNLGDYEMHGAFHNNIEITEVGIHKGLGLQKLGEYLGIELDEIMALGDGMNDETMIQMAGLGVVMKNGVEELKESADYITDSNNEDGVAKAIHKFVLEV